MDPLEGLRAALGAVPGQEEGRAGPGTRAEGPGRGSCTPSPAPELSLRLEGGAAHGACWRPPGLSPTVGFLPGASGAGKPTLTGGLAAEGFRVSC